MKKLALLVFLLLTGFSGAARAADYKTAIFAGGCFWCMEAEFSHTQGVSDVVSGFEGQGKKAPTYHEVATGETGFKEAVKVTYDPAIVTYKQLLDIFWSNVDPFDDKGQFCDKGAHYQAAIYFSTKQEHILAESSLMAVEKKFGKKVATQILPKANFFAAEDYHQDYYEKNKAQYERYKKGCGRTETLQEIWGDSPTK